jgi:predicted PurR-regulated permease PerM
VVQNEEMQRKMLKVLEHDGTLDAFRYIALQVWELLSQTAQILVGVVNVFVVFLYFFFILLDYETFSEGWQRLIPKDNRPAVVQLLTEVEDSMNRYFRGQGLIALLVGIGFAIGFSIVGLPMAVGVGLFIGLLNMVPYLQMLGIFPVTVLALLKASDTGESFWVIIGLCAIVFVVVQSLQDLVLTPKIMGSAMGMNPAVILLSLSVWGCLLGFIGLVIALPLTMLCFTYYKRIVLKEK